MSKLRRDTEVAFLQEKIVEGALNAARLRTLRFYVDVNGTQIRPSGDDVERHAEHFEKVAQGYAEDLLCTLSMTDDEFERRAAK